MSPPTKRMKSTRRVTTIDDLPPEMISELFEYLHPKDLIVCSMVNKRWYSIFVDFKVHSPVVIDHHRNYNNLFKWYRSNQTAEEKCFCPRMMFRRLAEKPLLCNLKQLALYAYRFKFDFNKLNQFQQLVHLEIKAIDEEELHLNLPNLKVLFCDFWNRHCASSIDCPLLSTLAYHGDASHLEVKHPETIRNLETDMVDPKWLVPFKSVEFLVIYRYEMISKATLLSLPRLRELRYIEDIERVFEIVSRHGAGTVDRVKRTLSEFLNETKKLRGGDFRFTFAGLHLANVNVDQIDFGLQVNASSGKECVLNEYVYMKNYHLIEPGALQFVRSVNYNRLLNHVTGEFPRCFSQKFTGIKDVWATAKVQDADHFLWFLKSLRFLRKLSLEKTGLSQEFYDQLPAIVRIDCR